MQRFPFDEVDVLVVGGGAAGLATGLTLGELGISSLVVERRSDSSTHPRATALTAATMELMQGWSIEPEVRQSGFMIQPVLSLRSCLVGHELNRIPMHEHVWACAQDRLEPILAERTCAAGTPNEATRHIWDQNAAMWDERMGDTGNDFQSLRDGALCRGKHH